MVDYTRPGWGGTNDDVPLHIEEHLGLVDGTFMYTSQFAPLIDIRNLKGTTTLRVDRLGKATVNGRKSGQPLVDTKIKNEKWLLSVDTLLYVRNEFDNFDLWTYDRVTRKEYAQEHGIALATQFDQACLIAAMKAGDFVVPTGLDGAFNPGILVPVSITSNPADGEANAAALVTAHRKGNEALINRDLGQRLYSEGVTFVRPDLFTVLLEHKKLMSVEYQSVGNDYAKSRVAMLNGVKVIETPRFPTSVITANPLGDAFNVTAAELRRGMVTIIPSLSLIAAQVHNLDAKYWEDEREFVWVLDTFQSYNIGSRRPDSVAVIDVTVN